MGRAPCCEKVGLKKGRWTAEEDEILAKYIQANGEGSWRSLPKNAGLLRCGKSCRLRWINYLRADLKRGNISAEEENTIVKLHASFGNRWSLIASHLPGRTDNEIKNYWNSHLSRKIYSFRKVANIDQTQQEGEVFTHTPKIVHIPPKRKVGRTSRWAMKKNKSYPQKDTHTHTPKLQTLTQHNNNIEAAVPPTLTPSLEREGNSSSKAVEDLTVLELESEIGDQKKEDEVNNRTYEKDLDWRVKESSDYDILGPCQLEGINDGSGALSIYDLLDSCLEACGVINLTEERENHQVVGVGEENERLWDDAYLNKIDDPDHGIGDWYSSKTLDFHDHWDWESVIEFNHNNHIAHPFDAYNWEHKENLLTWLWEDHDWESGAKKLEETDPQMQNDMVAWFLS